MGNKKNTIWIVELYDSIEKTNLLKVYEFCTISEIAFVLNIKPSTVSNFYHSLIRSRGVLKYINLYSKKIVV